MLVTSIPLASTGIIDVGIAIARDPHQGMRVAGVLAKMLVIAIASDVDERTWTPGLRRNLAGGSCCEARWPAGRRHFAGM